MMWLRWVNDMQVLQMAREVDRWSDSAILTSAEVSALISSQPNWEAIGARAVFSEGQTKGLCGSVLPSVERCMLSRSEWSNQVWMKALGGAPGLAMPSSLRVKENTHTHVCLARAVRTLSCKYYFRNAKAIRPCWLTLNRSLALVSC